MPLNMSYCLNPASLYKSTTKISAPPSLNTRVLGPYAPQGPKETPKKIPDENHSSDEGDASDDDEPLQSRVKRHPSVTSSRDSVIGMSPLLTASNGIARHPRQNNDSDVELILEDFNYEEAHNQYHPMFLDPGRKSLFTAVVGVASAKQIRKCSVKEYYHLTRPPI